MQHLRFNPFARPFKDLAPGDLTILRDVAEGWYVEYKSTAPNASRLAKSLSAFANQYGGYLFIGVEQDERRQAAAFPGIPLSELASVEQRIQQAVAQHVTPVAHYEVRSIRGPSAEIGLSPDRAIVIVRVREGEEAPYLHSSGKVYRRVGDGSDPVAETDRASLDLLWERSRRVARQLQDVLLQRPELSKAEDKNSYVHLYLLADPANAGALGSDLRLGEFSDILRNDKSHLFGMSFENCFPMSGGFVARHVQSNDPFNLVTTWRYHGGGNSILSVVIPWTNIDKHLVTVRTFLSGYEKASEFITLLQEHQHAHGWLLDVNFLAALYVMAVQKHVSLMTAEKTRGPVFAKLALEGVWRRTPFLDTNNFIEGIKKHGVPIVQDDTLLVPSGVARNTLLELPNEPGEIEEEERAKVATDPEALIFYRQAALLFGLTLNGLGVPVEVSLDALGEVVALVGRAMEVQRTRALFT